MCIRDSLYKQDGGKLVYINNEDLEMPMMNCLKYCILAVTIWRQYKKPYFSIRKMLRNSGDYIEPQ